MKRRHDTVLFQSSQGKRPFWLIDFSTAIRESKPLLAKLRFSVQAPQDLRPNIRQQITFWEWIKVYLFLLCIHRLCYVFQLHTCVRRDH